MRHNMNLVVSRKLKSAHIDCFGTATRVDAGQSQLSIKCMQTNDKATALPGAVVPTFGAREAAL